MASSSSSSPLAPAFSSQSWKYDVFLSFRGEDTRKNFVDHLYKALVQQGIDTYKDDNTLPRGESINPSLMKAIQESQIAIVIFSENYADSSWCLDELAHILKCKDTIGQTVIPIFYNVDPSEVRKQEQKYGEAFVKHELSNKNKVESWREALMEASNLAGWEPKNIANGHESKVIEEIVGSILSRLQQVTSSANENLIGVAARVQRLRSDLRIGSDDVRMVGIWGVGGGGKTTLASCVYNEISSKFEGCCFLENVREESSKHGLGKLKDDILSKMEANTIGGGGRSLISKRFRHKKVLIVLDDVDRLDQLEALVGSPAWFGEGSRIIITTRDKHLLNAHKVVVHGISLLNNNEAIELFRKHAPRGSRRMEDYEQISKEVVSYAGGLPLALKVLGCCLCDKNIDQWRSALARLEKTPDADIMGKLKISFDGLTEVQKDLFLDIACFYRGWYKPQVMDRLDACGFHPIIGVEELRQKALITISKTGYFDMHDLVQEMGHYIVRGEHPNNPAKHTRVWKKEDILKICAMDASTELDNIEATHVDEDIFPGQNLSPVVANMKNLRYIRWKGGNQLLDNFQPKELCCLVLCKGLQEQLWNGYKFLPKLKIIELWSLERLIMTPTFDGLPNLERFKLHGSSDLEKIHSSLGRLEKLAYLYICECPRIKKFPSVARLKKLEVIELIGCQNLFELLEIQQEMENLPHNIWKGLFTYIYGSGRGKREVNKSQQDLIDVDNNIIHKRLPNLRKLDLCDCKFGDEYMSSSFWDLPNLQELNLSHNNFARLNFGLLRLPQLKRLNVSDCSNLVEELSELNLPNLQELNLQSLSVSRLNFSRLPRLKLLKVTRCSCLVELSELPSSIAVVIVDGCTSLETFGDFSNCKWLWKVSLDRVYKVGPPLGNMLLDSMLKRNAFEEHHLSMELHHQMISNRFVGRPFRASEFTLRLPDDWYNDFRGFLIHVSTPHMSPEISIIMKQESNQAPESDVYGSHLRTTYVGYVSFSSLRRTNCFNSTYNVISFSIRDDCESNRIGVALVPKRSKDDPVQTTQVTTDCSQFQDGEIDYGPTFTIHQDSNLSTNILWRPRH